MGRFYPQSTDWGSRGSVRTMGSYLLVVVAGVFHTQVLHAASQLQGERKVISTAAYFWEGEHANKVFHALQETSFLDGDVGKAFQSLWQLPFPSGTLPASPPKDAGKHPSPLPREMLIHSCRG